MDSVSLAHRMKGEPLRCRALLRNSNADKSSRRSRAMQGKIVSVTDCSEVAERVISLGRCSMDPVRPTNSQTLHSSTSNAKLRCLACSLFVSPTSPDRLTSLLSRVIPSHPRISPSQEQHHQRFKPSQVSSKP